MFPVLICVSYLLGLVNIDVVSLIDQLQTVFPEAALDVVESYLVYISSHQSIGLFFAGLAAGWFSAAAAFRTVTQVIVDMYDEVSQSMLRGLVSSILFPLALLVTVNLSVMVVVTGQRTLAAVAQRLPFLSPAADLWSWTRYVLLFCIFFLFLMGVLNLAAPFGTPRLPMLVSSLVSALALVVSSAVFSWFIGLSTRLFAGVWVVGVPDHSAAVAVPVRADPVFGDCVYQCVVPAAKKITAPFRKKRPQVGARFGGVREFLLLDFLDGLW